MAISRARKEELVAKYVDLLSGADGLFVAEYRALTVAETEQLRHKLRENEGEFVVTKNTLLKIALEQAEWPVPEDLLTGPTGVVFSNGNMPGISKVVIDFAKDFEEKFAVKGGIMGESQFGPQDLESISTMPTLPEVQSQLLGILVQPASQLTGVVNAANSGIVNVMQPAVSQVLNVLNAHIEQNLKADGAEDAA